MNLYDVNQSQKKICESQGERRMEKSGLSENEILIDDAYAEKNFLSAVPSQLKFTFTSEDLETQQKSVEITNYCSKPCPIQILPLETRFFVIKNARRRRWLNPGSIFRISVAFSPEETRDYHDVLSIRYFKDKTLSINISAKHKTKISFPNHVNLGNVPLGRAAYYEIPVYPCLDKKFSFVVSSSKEDPCIDIYPQYGEVTPKKGAVIIMIIYRPLRYISMNFQVRIYIPDLRETPYVINFRAYTRPGLLRETLQCPDRDIKMRKQFARVKRVPGKEVKAIRRKDGESKPDDREFLVNNLVHEEALLKQLERIPLYTLHAVNCVLNSKLKRTHHEHELRGPLNVYISYSNEQKYNLQREFLVKAHEYRLENNKTKIHHKPKVDFGYGNLDEKEYVRKIKIEREQAWIDHEESMITATNDELFQRENVTKIRQRILRPSLKVLHFGKNII